TEHAKGNVRVSKYGITMHCTLQIKINIKINEEEETEERFFTPSERPCYRVYVNKFIDGHIVELYSVGVAALYMRLANCDKKINFSRFCQCDPPILNQVPNSKIGITS
ncbi:hypothetical protein L9F63_007660, partial [Diploptera punctata]